MHGHQAAWLRHLGEDPSRDGPALQSHRPQKRLLSAAHPLELPRQGSEPRGGIRHGVRRRHALGAQSGDFARRQDAARGQESARRAVRHSADQRDDHRALLRQVDPEPPRLAHAHQPMGQRHALGDADAPFLAHQRVSLARGAHRARDARRSARGSAPHAQRLCRRRRKRARQSRSSAAKRRTARSSPARCRAIASRR